MRSFANGNGNSTYNGPGPGQVTIAGVPLNPDHWWYLP